MGKENRNMHCNIATRHACDDEKNAWFASHEGNLLCRWDKKTGIIFKESFLLKENEDTIRAYGGICKWNDDIVIAPWRGQAVILVYHVKQKKMEEIRLKDFGKTDSGGKFVMCFAYGDYVYLMGYRYPAIVRLNMKSLKPEYITDWTSHIYDYWGESTKPCLTYGEIIGNIAVLPFEAAPGVLRVDLDTGNTQIRTIPISAKGFNSLAYAQGKFWLVDNHENRVVIWEPNTNAVSELRVDGEEVNQDNLFLRAAVAQEHLLLIPSKATNAYWISTKTEKVQKCIELESYICKSREKSETDLVGCSLIMQNSDGIYLDVYNDNYFYFYCYSDKQWSFIEKACDRLLAGVLVSPKYKDVIVESEEPKLEEFLQDVVNVDFPDIDRQKPRAIGESIYWTLKV